jgi:PAS domain S-box-containing protein
MSEAENRTKSHVRARYSSVGPEFVIESDIVAAISPDAIVAIDDDGRIIFANPRAGRLFGYTLDQLVGRDATTLVPERLRAIYRASLRRRRRRTFPAAGAWSSFTGLHRTGREIPLEVSMSNLVKENHRVAIWFVHDVSAKQHADHVATERSALLAQIADGVVIADPKGRITFVNEAARRLLGARPIGRASKFIALDAEFLTSDGIPLPASNVPLALTVRTGATIVNTELRVTRPDGSQAIVQASSTPIVARGGARLGSVATFRDVTAQREFELRKSEFIGAVSHELRTPITVIQGHAQLLARKVAASRTSSADVVARLEKINLTAKSMTSLVNRLIEATRSQLGQSIPISPRLRAQAITTAPEVEAISEVARALVRETALDRVASIIVDHSLRLFNAAGSTVWFFDPQLDALRPLAMRTVSAISPQTQTQLEALPLDATTMAGSAAQSKQPVEIPDIRRANLELTLAREIFEREHFLSGYAQPLVARGRLVGVLTVLYAAPQAFIAQERALIQALGDFGAAAIDNARLLNDEQKAREEAERLAAERAAILGHIADGVLLVDASGHVTFQNEAARQMIGEAPVGTYLPDFTRAIHLDKPDGRPYSPRDLLLVRALTKKETNIRVEQHARPPGKRAIILESSAAPVVGEGGEQLGAVLSLRDVTVERELEHERDGLYSAATHDLKNPLTVILGRAERLSRQARQSEVPELRRLVPMYDIIATTAKRTVSLIDELLDVIRARVGRPAVLNRRETDLVSLLRQVSAEYQPSNNHSQIRLVTKASELYGFWDAVRLERLFGNLLSNAIKYSPAGGEVVVNVRVVGKSTNRCAVVNVRDHGMGIPVADLPYIFDPFRRATNVGTRIVGSGIGLTSARYVAQQHGGTITAKSEEGVGSTFTVRLPLNVAEGVVTR